MLRHTVFSTFAATLVLALFAFAAPAGADWTGDGAGDVLAVDASGSLRVYRGSGTGLFTDAGQRIDGAGNDWGSFRDVFSTPDFTGDGKADMFVRTTTGQLRVYRGNGAGGFVDDGTLIGNGYGGFTALVAPGDFTGDGKADLIGRTPEGYLWLYRGNGYGGFIDNGAQTGGAGWGSFTGIYAAGDFSGDGLPDLFARQADGGLRLYRGNGAGGFLTGVTTPGGGWHSFDAILGGGDFSGDGKADVLARTPAGAFLVYRGNGAGSFADNGTLIGGGWNAFTALAGAADFSGDGKLDVLARLSDGSLRMLRGNGAGGLIDNGESAGGGWDTAVDVLAPGDFSGDGRPDLLARTAAGTLRLHRGDGNGGFLESGITLGTGWGSLTAVIAPGDWNGDGRADVLARTPAGAMLMYRGNGAGGFVDNGVQIGSSWNGFSNIYPAGDFDWDGDPDVLARTPTGQLYLYRGNGTGGFADNGTLLGNYWDNFTAITAGGDFSGDGFPDVLARNAAGELKLYRGNGAGGFVDNGVQPGAGWNAFTHIVLAGVGRYPTSERYGGANGAIDTVAEQAALIAAYDAISEAEGESFWNGMSPSDQDRIRATLGSGTAVQVDGAPDLFDWGPPSEIELDDLEVEPDDRATAAAHGRVGCRKTHDVKKIKLDLGVFGSPTIGKSVIETFFCWNKTKHKVTIDRDAHPNPVFDPSLSSKWRIAGFRITNKSTHIYPRRPWKGYENGELPMSGWFDLEECSPIDPTRLSCGTHAQLYHATYDHWDGTATARMGLR
jgi:VCBS repeat protein